MSAVNYLYGAWIIAVIAFMIYERRTNYFGRVRARRSLEGNGRGRKRVIDRTRLIAHIRTSIDPGLSERLSDTSIDEILSTKHKRMLLNAGYYAYLPVGDSQDIFQATAEELTSQSIAVTAEEVQAIDRAELDYLSKEGLTT